MELHKSSHIFRNIKRLTNILQILIKYGFGFIIDKSHLERYVPFAKLYKKTNRNIFDLSPEIRIRKIFEDLGPTFIKLGQILSTRSDLIPVSYCKEFEKLQDNTPSLDFSLMRQILEKEWPHPVPEVFQSIDPVPVGSASISQIHQACLVSGEHVVIKILKPGVIETIQTDFEILQYLARMSEKYLKENLVIDPRAIIHELRKSILKETNFLYEMKNIRRFARNLVKDKDIYVPKVYTEFCSRKVLILEQLKGYKITDIAALEKKKWNKKHIAHNLANSLFRQIFSYRLFHGDPHPGNILILTENKIAFIDFGLLGRLDELSKNVLIKLLQAFLNRDTTTFTFFVKKLVIFQSQQDEMDFQNDLGDLIDQYYSATLSEIPVRDVLMEIFDIMTRYRIKIPTNLFLLIRALIHLESIVQQIDPDFPLVEKIKPFVRSLLAEEFSVFEVFRKMKRFIFSFQGLLELLPSRVDDIIDKMERGQLKIRFELMEIHTFIDNLHRIVNRLVYSIISASLIVGSFFILHTDVKPQLAGYPLFSLAGFLLAFFLLLLLFADIFRSRRK
ncbi:MAG: AarF/UbiB family protein [bacterium]|nr:AarF/UbiB family protein [bacterium]